MPSARFYPDPHSTALAGLLKRLSGLLLLAAVAGGQTTRPLGSAALRDELTKLVAAGSFEDAIRRAQQALRDSPAEAGVKQEYVNLHLTLAQAWLAQRHFEAGTAALEAVLAVAPQHVQATRLLNELRAARERAGQQAPEIDRLLRLELFEAALERVQEVKVLRPDQAETWRDRERAAFLGAADDHYLARNFSEAFALYESVLASDLNATPQVHSRWAVALALALAESDLPKPTDLNAAGRLLARATDVLRQTNERMLGQIIGGLLAERAGELLEAGRTYAAALGEVWELPPADQRRDKIRRLREQAVLKAREIYRSTPVGRRDGFWTVALPDVWKNRRTPHFDVYAHNDLVAERVAEAAEYHFPQLSEWLGVAVADAWEPRCEIRVHTTLEQLQQATGTEGITFAVSHTRVQGGRILERKLEVFQADPWLLSSTLPHELTHLFIADAQREAGLPLAIDEGLALQAEPPARRLMYRRLLAPRPPDLTALLAATQTPADAEGFYAEAGALVGWLLDRAGQKLAAGAAQPAHGAPAGPDPLAQSAPGAPPESTPVSILLDAFRGGVAPDWWRRFGLDSAAALDVAWAKSYAARRAPARMPLMILDAPSPEHQKAPNGKRR